MLRKEVVRRKWPNEMLKTTMLKIQNKPIPVEPKVMKNDDASIKKALKK
ncbi:hypothetical protein ACOCEA_16645 [Maribacter sp. CXY002]